MGLYVLKESEETLKESTFEDILSDITEKPKNLLCTHEVKLRPLLGGDEKDLTVYKALKMSFKHESGTL
jgi:hypothetical protein